MQSETLRTTGNTAGKGERPGAITLAGRIGGGGTALRWLLGVLLTFVIAAVGTELAKLPVFDRLGAMVTSILIAIVFRQLVGYPERVRVGVQYAGKKLLRYAIVLYGLKLNIDVIVHQGLWLLLRDVGTIAIAIGVTLLLAKWLKADMSLSMLLGVGTGVCGAAAIAAVSPIVRAEDEDTAIGVGIIALMGTVFTIVYTLLRPVIHMTAVQYGVWCGVSLHEIAHVAAAASPAGQNALAVALLAKLGRVLLLVPLSFLLMALMKRRSKDHDGAVKVDFPGFLLGFVVMSLMGTYSDRLMSVPASWFHGLTAIGTFLLTAAMVGLGFNVNFQALRTKAFRPLVAMFIASVVLSVVTFTTIV